MPIFEGFASAAMTNLDAAYEIFKQAGQPLRFEQITEQALDNVLIAPHEVTTEATICRGHTYQLAGL